MTDAAQIRELSLQELGVSATGTTTQAKVAADLDSAYVNIYAMLDRLDITTWDFDEDIPDEFVIPVVALVAGSKKNAYSIPNDRYQRIAAEESTAILRIKEMQASNVYSTPEAEYF